jgi:hypothetical protein
VVQLLLLLQTVQLQQATRFLQQTLPVKVQVASRLAAEDSEVQKVLVQAVVLQDSLAHGCSAQRKPAQQLGHTQPTVIIVEQLAGLLIHQQISCGIRHHHGNFIK